MLRKKVLKSPDEKDILTGRREEKNMREKLTKSDVKKIEQEIEHRKLVVRKECLDAVKEARAHGDLSENFEYHAAKREKNQNESRIRYLENMLKNAIIISEETGKISVAKDGTLIADLKEDTLRTILIKNIITTVSAKAKDP